MPELPEVQTTLNGIKKFILNKRIKKCDVYVKKLRWELQKDLSTRINNAKITDIRRKAKYIILCGENFYLLFHLGMTGTLRIAKKNNELKKHDHFEIEINKKCLLRFNDPRKFGMIYCSHSWKSLSERFFLNIGPEPLSNNFSSEYLFSISRNKNVAIKTLLMNAKNVAGIGNIYASEALFVAKIRPQKKSKKLSKNNCKNLVRAIKSVLKKAIEKGGSSINDYINADGRSGYFQYDFKVYGRTSLPCHICQSNILQIKINQRSSFYCRNCQK
tara:strand:+ start:2761 stop:3579 length:819 start_codon:yes stop_codon:yes gene_type:complete